jgi:peroxiredoxin
MRVIATLTVLLAASCASAQEPVALNVAAPELAGITDWVNSEPLTLAGLKGKVVVLHFWTHGCINCVHNYPHMKSWHAAYADKGVTVLGVHTPEFPAEKKLDRIKKAAEKNELKYPIAVDNAGKTWTAWDNRWWPCVYLIDKRGVVRYRWDGELNSKTIKGEAVMRAKIEELLKEQ